MRQKDEQKTALFFASTLALVGQTGLSGLTIPLIAKQSGVATGTLYIYFKNKEDLIRALFQDVKKRFRANMFADIPADQPSRAALRQMWANALRYSVSNYAEYVFLQQFNASPYSREQATNAWSLELMQPLLQAIASGQKQGFIKPDKEYLIPQLFFGFIGQLTATLHAQPGAIADAFVEKSFRFFWDAIKQ